MSIWTLSILPALISATTGSLVAGSPQAHEVRCTERTFTAPTPLPAVGPAAAVGSAEGDASGDGSVLAAAVGAGSETALSAFLSLPQAAIVISSAIAPPVATRRRMLRVRAAVMCS